MNVIETFYFMFESDASKVKKGLADAGKSSDDLEKKLSTADAVTEKLGTNFLKMAKTAGEALAAVFALHAVKKLTEDTANHTYEVYQQAKAMNVSVESLSAWQHAVTASGGSAEGANQSMTGLRDKFVEMSRFGGMMGPEAFMFERLGLSAKDMHDSIKDPMIAMTKLAETFGTLDHTQALFLGKKLGLDQGTINLLSQGRRGLEEMIARQKELGVVTAQQAEASAKFKLKSAELGMTFETIAREITGELLPAFTWLMDGVEKVTQFFREHKTFTIAFFTAVGTAIAVAYLPEIIAATAATWAFVAGLLVAAAPFLLIAAAVMVAAGAIALIVDDIDSFMKGQNSVIGEAVRKWPILGEIFKALGEIISMSVEAIKTAFRALVKMVTGDVVGAFNFLKEKGSDAIDWLVKKFPFLSDAAKVLKQAMVSIVDDMIAPWKILFNLLSKLFDMLVKMPIASLNWFGKKLAKLTGGHYDEIGAPPAKAPAPGAPPVTPADRSAVAVTTAIKDRAMSDAPRPPASAAAAETGANIAGKLEKMGWTKEQAAGIAGSFMQESGGDAGVTNKTSGAYGLGQWLGSRVKDFKAWSGRELQGSSLDDQLAFFQHEVTHKEKRAGDMLRGAKTAAEAARIHSQYYERPGTAEANVARREAMAADILAGREQLAQTNSPISTTNSQTIANSSNVRGDTHVSVGPVAVHTQATDGEAVSRSMADVLSGHMRNALDQYDDGVAA